MIVMDKIYIFLFNKVFYYINMPKEIKLLILTHNYPRYQGDFAGVFISLLAKRLLQFNIQPVILAPHDTGIAEYEEIDGVKIYRFRYEKDESNENLAYRGNMHKLVLGSVSGIFRFKHFLNCFRQEARNIIDREAIDVAAGNWLVPSGMVMKSIATFKPMPMIMSSHGTDIRLMRKYFKVTYRYLKKFCLGLNRWTVVSNFLRNSIIELEPQLEKIIEVLPVPHDESIFYRDDNITREENLIVAVTRFTEQKRVTYLIKSFALVVEKKPEAKLHLYGSGHLQNDIEQLIAKFGLGNHVKIFPPIPQEQLREVYNRAAIVVLNSFQEGFGLALSEAMMCGAAAVGTNSGGITDIIKDRERGLIVELDNSAHLAEAILLLLNESDLRKKLADAGYQFAQRSYASQPLAERFAEIVSEALNDK